jgi:hypothetical protein
MANYARSTALAYLSNRFAEQVKDFSATFTDADAAAGWGDVLDEAFAEYGIAYDDLHGAACYATSADFRKIQALLRYFAWMMWVDRYQSRVDLYTEHPQPDAKLSQAFPNAQKALALAKAECVGFGYLAEASGTGKMLRQSRITTDALEPIDPELDEESA